jgi:sarcosine oxidase, subunit gamma
MTEGKAGGARPLLTTDRPDLGKLMLRADATTAEAAGAALGLSLPPPINCAARGDTVRALRLGPDEHLLVMARDALAGVAERLAQALAERHRAVVDLSARLVAVEIAGPAVRDVLATGCPLDLHPSVFGPDRASRTLFGKAEIILDCLADDWYRLLVNRSSAPYVRLLLAEASREHAVASASTSRKAGDEDQGAAGMAPA